MSRQVTDRARLIRFVAAPDGSVAADLDQRLPGRGIWVTAERDLLRRAIDRRLFRRAGPVTIDPTPALLDQVERGLAERCIGALGLARRAGAAVAGFEKVRAAGREDRLLLRLIALDAGANARQAFAGGGFADLPAVAALRAAELGQAFGRDHAVHAAITAGTGRGGPAFARRLRLLAGRLAGFRPPAFGPGLENPARGCIEPPTAV